MEFIFNGKSSSEFGLRVMSSNHLSLASKRIEEIEVPGRTGNLIIDDGSYKNKDITIECQLDSSKLDNFILVRNELFKWLQEPIGYQLLEYSDGTTFKAISKNQIDFEQLLKNYRSFNLIFSAYEVIE